MQPLYSRKIFPFRLGILMLVMLFVVSCQGTRILQPSPTPNILSTVVSDQRTKLATTPIPTLSPIKTITQDPASPQSTVAKDALISDPVTVIRNCEEILTTFNNKLKTTGWIRTVHTIVYFDNTQKIYRDPKVMEQWYRLDPDGQLVEGYTWLSTPDGVVEQETLFQGGIWYNVTLGGSSHSINTKVDFTSGIVDGLKNGEKITQEAVRYHDTDAWRFFYELNDGGRQMARAMFFDRGSNLLSGNETYAVQPDGSLQLVSGAIYSSFEINVDPPLDRFQQILEKAQKVH